MDDYSANVSLLSRLKQDLLQPADLFDPSASQIYRTQAENNFALNGSWDE